MRTAGPMSPTFLELPREIRDQIYKHVLLSPTGTIEAHLIPRRDEQNVGSSPKHIHTTPISKGAVPRFKLLIVQSQDHKVQNVQDTSSTYYPGGKMEYITLSLLRTNRQIYHETHSLFWENTTFTFREQQARYRCIRVGSGDSGDSVRILQTLKAMSQVPSRLITSISLNMPTLRASRPLPKLLQLLRSRSRHGKFRRLELIWNSWDLKLLTYKWADVQAGMINCRTEGWDDLISTLWKAEEGCKFERIVTFRVDGFNCQELRSVEGVAAAINGALGGSLYMGDVLAWKDGHKIRPLSES